MYSFAGLFLHMYDVAIGFYDPCLWITGFVYFENKFILRYPEAGNFIIIF